MSSFDGSENSSDLTLFSHGDTTEFSDDNFAVDSDEMKNTRNVNTLTRPFLVIVLVLVVFGIVLVIFLFTMLILSHATKIKSSSNDLHERNVVKISPNIHYQSEPTFTDHENYNVKMIEGERKRKKKKKKRRSRIYTIDFDLYCCPLDEEEMKALKEEEERIEREQREAAEELEVEKSDEGVMGGMFTDYRRSFLDPNALSRAFKDLKNDKFAHCDMMASRQEIDWPGQSTEQVEREVGSMLKGQEGAQIEHGKIEYGFAEPGSDDSKSPKELCPRGTKLEYEIHEIQKTNFVPEYKCYGDCDFALDPNYEGFLDVFVLVNGLRTEDTKDVLKLWKSLRKKCSYYQFKETIRNAPSQEAVSKKLREIADDFCKELELTFDEEEMKNPLKSGRNKFKHVCISGEAQCEYRTNQLTE